MVLPPLLAQSLKTAHSELYRGGHWLTQATLAQFIHEGHYAAHIRRMRLLYARRRALLTSLIEQHLGADYVGDNSNAGAAYAAQSASSYRRCRAKRGNLAPWRDG